MERCLVCILAQTRAATLTWENFKTNVLRSLKADLALAVSETNEDDGFRREAKYIWTFPEVTDWGIAFDYAQECIGIKENWRILLKIKDQWLGGVVDSADQHPGSAGILLFFRWFLLHKLKVAGLLENYDRFIITRSDFFYLCPHPPLELLPADKIWIPDGEYYGGISDRHLVVSRNDLESALGVVEDIFCNSLRLFDEMKSRHNWNLEQFLDFQFRKRGIRERCRFFPWVMYSVREPAGSSRWSMGNYNARLNQIIKYSNELESAERWANEYARAKNWFDLGIPEKT